MDKETAVRLDSAIAAARLAGTLIKDSFGTAFHSEYKEWNDPVTEIDRRSELLIKERLARSHPDIGFWGEEFGRTEGSGDLFWLVDPLDGTKNFVHGYPFVAVSIALVRNERTLLGVVYDPLRDHLFHAVRGEGAFRDGRPIQVSRTQTAAEAMVVTGFSLFPPHQKHLILKACERCQGLRRGGAAVLDLCQVAAGHLDAQWEWTLKPWDLAAAVLMIEEAQGTVTRVDGSPFDLHGGEILATNTTLHREFVQFLAEGARSQRG